VAYPAISTLFLALHPGLFSNSRSSYRAPDAQSAPACLTGRGTKSMMRTTSAAARGARKEEHAMIQKNIGRNTRCVIPAVAFERVRPRRGAFRGRAIRPSAGASDYTSGNKQKNA